MSRPRATYANVAATVALLLAVSGGAYSLASFPEMTRTISGPVNVIGNEKDVPTDNPKAVRVLSVPHLGILKIPELGCAQMTGMVTALLTWTNTTTSKQTISFEREGTTNSNAIVGGKTATVDLMLRYTSKDIFQGEFRVSDYRGKHAVIDISVAVVPTHCRVTTDGVVVS
jgi:hypothetical protein